MHLASNVVRQMPLISELVNLATARVRGGAAVPRLDADELLVAFAALVNEPLADALRADPHAGQALADLACRLRDAIVAPTPADTVTRINAMIRRYGAQPYLVDDVDQPFHLHFHGTGGSRVGELGGEFATALALIVDGYGTDRFGQCQAQRCEAVYVDLTRNGSRRFCGAACTARAKSAAYRTRRRG